MPEVEPSSHEARQVLAALRGARPLLPIALRAVAEQRAADVLAGRCTLADVLAAVPDLEADAAGAAATGNPWPAELMAKKFRSYVGEAKRRRESPPSRRGVSAPVQPAIPGKSWVDPKRRITFPRATQPEMPPAAAGDKPR